MLALIPVLVAGVLVVLGFSYLLQAPRWLHLVRELTGEPERLFLPAIGMVAAGIAIGYGYDSWHGTWPIFVTVLGWLLALKGALWLIAPGIVRPLLQRLTDRFLLAYTRCGGVLLIVLGVLLGRQHV